MWQLAILLLCAALQPSWAYGDDDAQYIQPVKGGHSGRGWTHGASLYRPHQNASLSGSGTGYGVRPNFNTQVEHEVGVCYIEVPTADLVRDRSHVPAGNGSRPDLSRIRTCCKGYERNIYNYLKCDPICTKECVNALCVAPDICSCYPDHVKNLAGVCIATCPIGCQNGHCEGGECLCKDGYKLDIDGRYCVPYCKDNCGGIGNCTAPNVCECNREGYHSTSDGSCRATCDRCVNGDCVAPNQCRCRQGYEMDLNGECKPQCHQNCGPGGRCVSPNVCEYPSTTRRPEAAGYPYPNGYPSQYVTQSPGGQPQYPANQHSYNPTNPQQYPSGSGHYVINSESTQHTGNTQQSSYNTSGFVQYPLNPQQPVYPQYNSSGTVHHSSNSQQPSHPLYSPSGVILHPEYPGYPQQSSHTQYPTGSVQNPSNLQNFSHSQNNSLAPSQYPTNPQYPTNSQYPTNPQYPSNPQYPINPQHPLYGQYYPSNPQHSSNSQDFTVIPIDQSLQFGYPQCSQACINATCVEGNRCACHAGFVPDRTDPTESRCVPYCPGGCPNGDCVSPYACACHEGYKLESHGVKGARPRCVRRERRSLHQDNKEISKREANVADFLVFMLPDYDN